MRTESSVNAMIGVISRMLLVIQYREREDTEDVHTDVAGVDKQELRVDK